MKKSLIGIFLSILVCLPFFSAQEMSIPVNIQYKLFLKILEYERNLQDIEADEIVMGVLYQEKFRLSKLTKEEIISLNQQNSAQKIGGKVIRFIPIKATSKKALEKTLTNNGIHVLYVTPLRAYDVKIVADICRAKKITSLTGVPDYLNSGIAVALGLDKQKPRIMINLSAAKASGCDFSSQLLNLAQVSQ